MLTIANAEETGRIGALAAPVQGTVLSAPVITDPDGGVRVTTWLWEVSGDGGTSWSALATTSSVTPAQAEVGKLLRLTVWYEDGYGAENRVMTGPSSAVADIDDAPTALVLSRSGVRLSEDTATTARVKMADITVTDIDGGDHRLVLSGTDAKHFEIHDGGLYLKAGKVRMFWMAEPVRIC